MPFFNIIQSNSFVSFNKKRSPAAAGGINGTLWSWGTNGSGRLGLGDTANRSSPNQIGLLTSWGTISLGENSALAL
jgi:alpha-tubulin suppressor-like RCC1 family protein